MVNNSTNITKTNNYLSSQTTAHTNKTNICNENPGPVLRHTNMSCL